jgi:hypothetical protein
MRWAVVGRAGDTTTRVSLNVEERRRERRAVFAEGELTGSMDGAGEREEEEWEGEGEGENGEKYTGEGTHTSGTGITEPGSPLANSRRDPNSVSVWVHTGVVTGTSLRFGKAYRRSSKILREW